MKDIRQTANGHNFFKILRFYMKCDLYKAVHKQYLMQDLVSWRDGLLKDKLMEFIKDAGKYFHKGLDERF